MSRSVANTILRATALIISMAMQLVEASLRSSGILVNLSNFDIPQDVRMAYSLQFVEPDIIQTACCPTCFSLYSQPIPWKCEWKETQRACPCNTELWKERNTPKGLKMIPRRLYTTQSFDSWLRFFLSRDVIIESLEETLRRTQLPFVFGAEMRDIQDSLAWRELMGPHPSAYHLRFSFYVDWFNPYTNKIAGEWWWGCSIYCLLTISDYISRQKCVLRRNHFLLSKSAPTPTLLP